MAKKSKYAGIEQALKDLPMDECLNVYIHEGGDLLNLRSALQRMEKKLKINIKTRTLESNKGISVWKVESKDDTPDYKIEFYRV